MVNDSFYDVESVGSGYDELRRWKVLNEDLGNAAPTTTHWLLSKLAQLQLVIRTNETKINDEDGTHRAVKASKNEWNVGPMHVIDKRMNGRGN